MLNTFYEKKELNDHNHCTGAWEAEGKEDQHPGLIHDKYDTVLSCAKYVGPDM